MMERFIFLSFLLWYFTVAAADSTGTVANSAVVSGLAIACSGPGDVVLTQGELGTSTLRWRCAFNNSRGTAAHTVRVASSAAALPTTATAALAAGQARTLSLRLTAAFTAAAPVQVSFWAVVDEGKEPRATITSRVTVYPEPFIRSLSFQVPGTDSCVLAQKDSDGFEATVGLSGDTTAATLKAVAWAASSGVPLVTTTLEQAVVTVSQSYFASTTASLFTLTATITLQLANSNATLSRDRQCTVLINRGPNGVLATTAVLDGSGRAPADWVAGRNYTAIISGWSHSLGIQLMYSLWFYVASSSDNLFRLTPDAVNTTVPVTMPMEATEVDIVIITRATDAYGYSVTSCLQCAVRKTLRPSSGQNAGVDYGEMTLPDVLQTLAATTLTTDELGAFVDGVAQWVVPADVDEFLRLTAVSWASHLRRRGAVTQYDAKVVALFRTLLAMAGVSSAAIQASAEVYGAVLRRLSQPTVQASRDLWRAYPGSTVQPTAAKFAPQSLDDPMGGNATSTLLAAVEAAQRQLAAVLPMRDIGCLRSEVGGACFAACVMTDAAQHLTTTARQMVPLQATYLDDGQRALVHWVVANGFWLDSIVKTLPDTITVASTQVAEDCNALTVPDHLAGPMWRVQLYDAATGGDVTPTLPDGTQVVMPLASSGGADDSDCTLYLEGWPHVEVIPRSPLNANCLSPTLQGWVTLTDPNTFSPTDYSPFPWTWLLVSEGSVVLLLAIGLGLCWYARRPPRHSEELPQPGDEESAPSEGEGERPWRGPYEAEFHKTAEALAGEILEKGEFWEGKDVPTGGILGLEAAPATARVHPPTRMQSVYPSLKVPTPTTPSQPSNPLMPSWIPSPRNQNPLMSDTQLNERRTPRSSRSSPTSATAVATAAAKGPSLNLSLPSSVRSMLFPPQVYRIPVVKEPPTNPLPAGLPRMLPRSTPVPASPMWMDRDRSHPLAATLMDDQSRSSSASRARPMARVRAGAGFPLEWMQGPGAGDKAPAILFSTIKPPVAAPRHAVAATSSSSLDAAAAAAATPVSWMSGLRRDPLDASLMDSPQHAKQAARLTPLELSLMSPRSRNRSPPAKLADFYPPPVEGEEGHSSASRAAGVPATTPVSWLSGLHKDPLDVSLMDSPQFAKPVSQVAPLEMCMMSPRIRSRKPSAHPPAGDGDAAHSGDGSADPAAGPRRTTPATASTTTRTTPVSWMSGLRRDPLDVSLMDSPQFAQLDVSRMSPRSRSHLPPAQLLGCYPPADDGEGHDNSGTAAPLQASAEGVADAALPVDWMSGLRRDPLDISLMDGPQSAQPAAPLDMAAMSPRSRDYLTPAQLLGSYPPAGDKEGDGSASAAAAGRELAAPRRTAPPGTPPPSAAAPPVDWLSGLRRDPLDVSLMDGPRFAQPDVPLDAAIMSPRSHNYLPPAELLDSLPSADNAGMAAAAEVGQPSAAPKGAAKSAAPAPPVSWLSGLRQDPLDASVLDVPPAATPGVERAATLDMQDVELSVVSPSNRSRALAAGPLDSSDRDVSQPPVHGSAGTAAPGPAAACKPPATGPKPAPPPVAPAAPVTAASPPVNWLSGLRQDPQDVSLLEGSEVAQPRSPASVASVAPPAAVVPHPPVPTPTPAVEDGPAKPKGPGVRRQPPLQLEASMLSPVDSAARLPDEAYLLDSPTARSPGWPPSRPGPLQAAVRPVSPVHAAVRPPSPLGSPPTTTTTTTPPSPKPAPPADSDAEQDAPDAPRAGGAPKRAPLSVNWLTAPREDPLGAADLTLLDSPRASLPGRPVSPVRAAVRPPSPPPDGIEVRRPGSPPPPPTTTAAPTPPSPKPAPPVDSDDEQEAPDAPRAGGAPKRAPLSVDWLTAPRGDPLGAADLTLLDSPRASPPPQARATSPEAPVDAALLSPVHGMRRNASEVLLLDSPRGGRPQPEGPGPEGAAAAPALPVPHHAYARAASPNMAQRRVMGGAPKHTPLSVDWLTAPREDPLGAADLTLLDSPRASPPPQARATSPAAPADAALLSPVHGMRRGYTEVMVLDTPRGPGPRLEVVVPEGPMLQAPRHTSRLTRAIPEPLDPAQRRAAGEPVDAAFMSPVHQPGLRRGFTEVMVLDTPRGGGLRLGVTPDTPPHLVPGPATPPARESPDAQRRETSPTSGGEPVDTAFLSPVHRPGLRRNFTEVMLLDTPRGSGPRLEGAAPAGPAGRTLQVPPHAYAYARAPADAALLSPVGRPGRQHTVTEFTLLDSPRSDGAALRPEADFLDDDGK